MEIWTIAGVGLVGAVLCVLVKQYRPEFGMLVSLSCGMLLFVMVLMNLTPALDRINGYMEKLSLDNGYFKVLLKSLGICYIATIAGDTCRDAGQTAIAGKIELSAKVGIVLLALPLFEQIVEYALELIAI